MITSRPYSIRIFLPDGVPDGLQILEKSNWTGIGIVVPKAKLSDSKSRVEFSRTGVYVLEGFDEETEGTKIYIGQGDPVRDRLEQHAAKKEFWNRAVFFVTRDDSLNKAHIGYLETSLIKLARKTKRVLLENANLPQPSPLAEADAADMESFLADMLSIFPLVGVNAFEQLETRVSPKDLFRLSSREVLAQGYESSQGFVVLAGSQAIMQPLPSMPNNYANLRLSLIKKEVLVPDQSYLRFAENYEFSSSSAAASVTLARAASGPQAWINSEGVSLRQVHEAMNSD